MPLSSPTVRRPLVSKGNRRNDICNSDPTQNYGPTEPAYPRPMPKAPAIHVVSGQRPAQPVSDLMAAVGRVIDRKFDDRPGSCDVCGATFLTWESYCRHLPGEVRS